MLDFFRDSRFFGRPIELYKFTYGPLESHVHLMTDAEQPITYAGGVYYPVQIKRGSTSNSGTLDKSSLEISVPAGTPVPEMFRIYPPGHVVGLTVLQGESADPDAEFSAIWVGRVLSCSWEGIEAKLNCEPVSTSFRRAGLRRNYQYMCPHVLYGPQCKAGKVAASSVAVVHSVTGRDVEITVLIADASRYEGGMLEWVRADGRSEARTIVSLVSTDPLRTGFRLTGPASGLMVGQTLTMVLGCRHTLQSCGDLHANSPNFGGMPWIPLQNPIGNVSPYQ
jgi:hypothetical protein